MTSTDGGAETSGEPGERLAAWLDGLELLPHLATAGLPSVVRDDQGRAVWTDPATGEELGDERLAELEAMLREQGSDPRHGVPVGLLQIARQARVREELLTRPWFTYESLAELRGTSVNATRFAVVKAAGEHHLLVVAEGERSLVPAFQLDEAGQPRADLAPVLRPLLAAGMDPWRAWGWLTQPAALLGGRVPEQAAADPDLHDVAAHAAVRLAERVADRS